MGVTAPPPAGIIILGGAEDRLVGRARGVPTLNEAGERLLEGAILAKRFPDAKIAFSGGAAGILYKSDTEAEGAAVLLTELGVARDRLILESDARDTYENAAFLKKELEQRSELDANTRCNSLRDRASWSNSRAAAEFADHRGIGFAAVSASGRW